MKRAFMLSLLAAFALAAALPAHGQDEYALDLFRPHLSLTVGGFPGADTTDVPGSYSSRAGALSLAVPIAGGRLGEGSSSRFQLVASARFRAADSEIGFLGDRRTLYTGGVGMTAIYVPGAANSFVLSVGAGLAEDEKTIRSPQGRASAFLLGVRRTSPAFSFTYGLGYSYVFGKGRALPAFGLTWRPAPRWRVHALLPFNAVAAYRASQTVSVGLRLGADGNRYRIANDAIFPGQPDSLTLRMTGLKVAAEAAFHLAEGITVRLEAGALAFRKLSVWDGDTELLSTGVKASPYAAATVGIALGGKDRDSWDPPR